MLVACLLFNLNYPFYIAFSFFVIAESDGADEKSSAMNQGSADDFNPHERYGCLSIGIASVKFHFAFFVKGHKKVLSFSIKSHCSLIGPFCSQKLPEFEVQRHFGHAFWTICENAKVIGPILHLTVQKNVPLNDTVFQNPVTLDPISDKIKELWN